MEYVRPDSIDGMNVFLTMEAMRELGFYVRMTEWHDGFQVCAFKATDIRKGYVSSWCKTEKEAALECLQGVRKIVENTNEHHTDEKR